MDKFFINRFLLEFDLKNPGTISIKTAIKKKARITCSNSIL